MKKIDWKALIIAVVIPLAVGALAGFLIMDGVEEYTASVIKPPLAPPALLFPIVWSVLYILMGISSYLIYKARADAEQKKRALIVYGIQLIVNFIWPLVFFNMQAYLLAFILLLALIALVSYMVVLFSRIDATAALLDLPYIAWLLFAAYLNFGVYMLNK